MHIVGLIDKAHRANLCDSTAFLFTVAPGDVTVHWQISYQLFCDFSHTKASIDVEVERCVFVCYWVSHNCSVILVISAKWTEWNWRIYCFHFCLSVCLCVCVHSVQSSTVCVPPTTHQLSPSCNPCLSPNPWLMEIHLADICTLWAPSSLLCVQLCWVSTVLCVELVCYVSCRRSCVGHRSACGHCHRHRCHHSYCLLHQVHH